MIWIKFEKNNTSQHFIIDNQNENNWYLIEKFLIACSCVCINSIADFQFKNKLILIMILLNLISNWINEWNKMINSAEFNTKM